MSIGCIFILCSLTLVVGARNSENITLGSTLIAGVASSSSWVSPSGDFAFGFQQLAATEGFLLAIWFSKIPDKTVTWSANRDQLAQIGSRLQLTANGLALRDPNDNLMWSATGSGVDYAAMLDSGNLMLADVNGDKIWQSFDDPTDTILPTQIMSEGTVLIARFSDTNYSSGRFDLNMQGDGNLVSYALNWPQKSESGGAYWASNTVGIGIQVVFNQSGMIYVAAKNGTMVVASLINDQIDEDHYQRAILEFDGVFRRYVYPRSSATNQPMNWTMSTDVVPEDICKAMNQRLVDLGEGGGACGFNSLCEIGDDKRPKCGCPPGYSFLDEMDHIKGCQPNFIAQSCSKEPQQNDQFELIEMSPTDFGGVDLEDFPGLSETACRDSCSSDCMCAAAVFDGQRCRKKTSPLYNGWVGPDAGAKTFIKVGNVTSSTNSEPTIHGDSHKYQPIGWICF